MSKSIPSHAEPVMLEWCRERASFTIEETADHLAVADSEIRFWEMGEKTPSLTQLRKLARFYKFPTAAFYLRNPPKWHTIRDHRRLPEAQKGKHSPELAYIARVTQGRQEWLESYLQSQTRKPLTFVGSANLAEKPRDVGKRLRKLLGIKIEQQKLFASKEAAFRQWRSRCESVGVAVFLSRRVSVEEMRGFALSHPTAPIVVVNDRDKPGGKIFTLMHEMAHILLNISGISERIVLETASTPDQKIEIFCNAVAGEALIPSDDFVSRVSKYEDDYEQAIPILSGIYSVSDDVVTRRLRDHGFISHDHYERLMAQYKERLQSAKVKKQRDVKIKMFRRVLATVGRNFGRAVVSAYRNDLITGPEASDLLDMKVQFIPDLENALYSG